MSNYTITLVDLLKTDFKLALNDYPIFDENYRNILNDKIKNKFLYREIGFNSPDLFNHYLSQTMNEIMPYYNMIYKKIYSDNFDIFDNVNIKEIYKAINDSTNDINSLSVSQNKNNNSSELENVFSEGIKTNKNIENDTPQKHIQISDINNGGYMSKYTINQSSSENDITKNKVKSNSTDESDNKTTQKSINNTISNYEKNIKGNQSNSNIDLLNNIIKSYANIDSIILLQLENLFMQIY